MRDLFRGEKNKRGTMVFYGEVGILPSPVGKEEALSSKAVILRPPNGWAILYGSNKYVVIRRNIKSKSQRTEFFFGPMNNRGFWLLMEADGSKEQTFIFLSTLMMKNEEPFEIHQDIAKGHKWKSVQMFEWKSELFVCFSTIGKTLVVVRLKNRPDRIDAHGTYISSFFVESTTNPEAFFLPSYPDPVLYYSSSEKDGVRVFHALDLRDVIKESDRGFDECQKNGRYPSNFMRLRPYLKNLTIVAANNSYSCESSDITLFHWNKSSPCFELGPDVFASSVDMYTVALDFKAKILAYLEKDEDVRCDLSKCGESMADCVREKVDFKQEIIASTYWNLDDFALTRWTRSGSRLKFRLLNCASFTTCPLCTLYGGLSCVWRFSRCRMKDNSSKISQSACFSDVEVTKKQLPHGKMELSVSLPYKLNEKIGENVSIKLDGKEFPKVDYIGGVYKVETVEMSFGLGTIVIKRGPYIMNSTFSFRQPGSTMILKFILYLFLALIALSVSLGLIAYSIIKEKDKNVFSSRPGPFPANINQNKS
ncbi:uncharacterized protein LOC141849742 isoform X2 [Brevipalpus obovatus]|uniref:uncharacterized protein LOC141849742 isoform X2 n=1 Tax=Brevipalpus obovatus TaxID=246614 RepID=UPI003D9F64CE